MRRRRTGSWRCPVVIAALLAVAARDPGPTAPAPDNVADVLSLPIDVRDAGRRVRLRAVVTMWQPPDDIGVVQDATAGIWVSCSDEAVKKKVRGVIRPGMEVILEGRLYRGGYSPLLLMDRVEFIQERDLPAPQPADLERLFIGADNGLRVSVEGVVQGCATGGNQLRLLLACGAHRLAVQVLDPAGLPGRDRLLDSQVRVTGVVGSVRNTRGEFLAPRLVANGTADVVVVEPSSSDVTGVPTIPLAELGRYQFEPRTTRRVAVSGTVTYASPDAVFVQDGVRGCRILPSRPVSLVPGDRVRVTGFIDTARRIAGLREAAIERLGPGQPPNAARVTPDTIYTINAAAMAHHEMAEPCDYDGCLIEFVATVAEVRARGENGGDVILGDVGTPTLATFAADAFRRLPALRPGSSVRVRGVAQIHLLDDDAIAGIVAPMLRQVTVLPRSAADIEVLSMPSWWTPRRLASLLAGVAAVLAGALVWVGLLRREIHSQSRMLAREMRLRRDAAIEYDASLRERNRLAANLHDTLLQTLGGIDYQLGACRAAVPDTAGAGGSHLDVAGRMVEHAMRELRGSVWALRTVPLAGHSLAESLESLAAQSALGRGERIAITVGGPPFHVPNFVAGNLLLVAQEAIRNALHHADCRTIDVSLQFDAAAAAIEVEVQDDGRGFDPAREPGPDRGHFGLQGMRERVERLGGTLTITSTPGSGTRVRARVLIRDYDSDLDDAPAADA
ncbi:MAG: sensor histidine kinase [Planctomycetaceae bacterium]